MDLLTHFFPFHFRAEWIFGSESTSSVHIEILYLNKLWTKNFEIWIGITLVIPELLI